MARSLPVSCPLREALELQGAAVTSTMISERTGPGRPTWPFSAALVVASVQPTPPRTSGLVDPIGLMVSSKHCRPLGPAGQLPSTQMKSLQVLGWVAVVA